MNKLSMKQYSINTDADNYLDPFMEECVSGGYYLSSEADAVITYLFAALAWESAELAWHREALADAQLRLAAITAMANDEKSVAEIVNRLFASKGNHSEMHISRNDLTNIIVGILQALQTIRGNV